MRVRWKKLPRLQRTTRAATASATTAMRSGSWISARGQITYTRSGIGRRAKRLLQIAGECGLRTGITIPCHSPGAGWAFLTFATDGIHDLREMAPAIAGRGARLVAP
jgi:hypothetical protein